MRAIIDVDEVDKSHGTRLNISSLQCGSGTMRLYYFINSSRNIYLFETSSGEELAAPYSILNAGLSVMSVNV